MSEIDPYQRTGSLAHIGRSLDDDGSVVISIVGELDLSNIESTRSELVSMTDDDAKVVIFDLAGLTFDRQLWNCSVAPNSRQDWHCHYAERL